MTVRCHFLAEEGQHHGQGFSQNDMGNRDGTALHTEALLACNKKDWEYGLSCQCRVSRLSEVQSLDGFNPPGRDRCMKREHVTKERHFGQLPNYHVFSRTRRALGLLSGPVEVEQQMSKR